MLNKIFSSLGWEGKYEFLLNPCNGSQLFFPLFQETQSNPLAQNQNLLPKKKFVKFFLLLLIVFQSVHCRWNYPGSAPNDDKSCYVDEPCEVLQELQLQSIGEILKKECQPPWPLDG
ncbi:hypothetical protein Pfo_017683 [Paulownia fortunei]|nr:hypothetical protein Pfo_017683 [Paulownia fortunei]